MPIPRQLDTFVINDHIVIKPELAFHKTTMEPAIFVQVWDRRSNSVVETRLFPTQEAYEEFVAEMVKKAQ